METKKTETELRLEIGKDIKVSLIIDGDDSSDILRKFIDYHWDEFKKDELMGMIQAAEWLKIRSINHRLIPSRNCSLWGRIWSIFYLKIAKEASIYKRG